MNSTSTSPRTIIVTGAAGGMGQATCRALAAQGDHLLGIDIAADRLALLASELPSFRSVAVDLGAQSLPTQVARALQDMPPVAGLVNLAGISHGDAIDKLDDEAWERSFAVNVFPAMRLIRLIAPMLRGQKGGSIVNVGSPVGVVGARKPSYAASKSALHGLTMSCARNLGPDNIRVNLLLPGPTITGMTSDWDEPQREAIAAGSFLKRLCTPEEIARVIAFLLGESSSYVTGSVVDMTAGSMWGH